MLTFNLDVFPVNAIVAQTVPFRCGEIFLSEPHLNVSARRPVCIVVLLEDFVASLIELLKGSLFLPTNNDVGQPNQDNGQTKRYAKAPRISQARHIVLKFLALAIDRLHCFGEGLLVTSWKFFGGKFFEETYNLFMGMDGR